MKSKTRRVLSGVALFLSALAVQRASTTPWGEGAAADGTHLLLSPIGLSHVVRPQDPIAPTVECRWWPRIGDASLCAPAAGGDRAYERLRLAYPALLVALWLAVGALLLQALRIPRAPAAHVALSAATFALVMSALVIVTRSGPDALAALQGVKLRFDSLGFVLAAGAAMLTAASAFLAAERGSAPPDPR